MSRVDADLQRLQPVARPQALEGEHVRVGCDEAVERREWRGLAGPHVSPDDAAALDARDKPAAGPCGGTCCPCGSAGCSRQAPATSYSQPWNGQRRPPSSQRAKRQVGAAVCAMAVQQAVASGRIAEQHQVFAEQADPFHRAWRHRAPRPARPAASNAASARRTGCRVRLGDQPVLLGGEHSPRFPIVGADEHSVAAAGWSQV